MELALRHVVVRICGPGVGVDLVAALSVHAVELSEARDLSEVHRVACGRPPILIVVVAPQLDDFGSGICRLRYLTQLPLAMVKLDALVTGYIDDDPLQREFVRTVVSLCRARGITTVAEYTRSPEQLARLVDDGVDLFQGELFGMPQPAADVLAPATPSEAHA